MLPIVPASLAPLSRGTPEASPATSARSKPVDTAEQQKEQQKLKKAAGDFESILLSSMWKSMKKSFADSTDGETDPASGTIDDLGIEAMSSSVGKAGGLGIGKLIIEHLTPPNGGPSEK